MNTGILMLAAGYSRRFGGDKRRAQLENGDTVLARSVAGASASGLPLVICLHPGDEDLAKALAGPGVSPLICPTAADGMGASLAWGVDRLSAWDGVLVALADMPFVQSATFCKVAESMDIGLICQPWLAERPGHPVGFGRHFFPELQALEGDVGARDVVAQHRERLVRIEVDDPGILQDVDRPEDL